MFDYAILKLLWWFIIGIILIVYATTAGYDLGVTMIMPFFKKEQDRRLTLNASAPTWDGNQTWVVFAGGCLFVVWPVVYSTAFSGMYAAMFCILWGFFLRPPGYDYRGKIDHPTWRRFWDWGLFVSSILPVFIFGVVFGNCLLGYPFHFDPITLREFYTGNFFQLFSGFGILAGVVSVVMIVMHGAAYLQRRTEGNVCEQARKVHAVFAIILLILFSIAGYWVSNDIAGYQLISSPAQPTINTLSNVVTHYKGAWIAQYSNYPWKYYSPVITYFAVIISVLANYHRWHNSCFWASVCAVGGVIATSGGTLFPFIMPSSTNLNESLTVWNSTANQYALEVMTYVGIVLLLIIMCYKFFVFHSTWHDKPTLSTKDIEEDSHTFY